MIALLLGLGLMLLLMAVARGFSMAKVETVRNLLAWVSALAGLALATLLLLSGRGPAAFSALVFFSPLVISWWQQARQERRGNQAGPGPRPGARPARPARGGMSRQEALEVLGLAEGASRDDISAAYMRLMQAVHPDHGGSSWMAARLNQARDTLLGR